MDKKIEKVLEIFKKINSIPRKSKNEEAISNWLVEWAKSNSFKVVRDDFLDVLITVPASKGYEDRPTIVFQGHMDMVCEKIPESNHDFSKDPIEMYIDGDWLKARETSLGADNGIALALAIAIAEDKDVKHPELELLFTVDEETGLTGAVNLKANWVQGKKLINIDSEDEGVFTIGCAGGRDAKIELSSPLVENYKYDTSLIVEVGGVSGDIHLEKANSNILLTRLLKEISYKGIGFKLAELNGGSAHNAISRSSRAHIAINSCDIVTIKEILNSKLKLMKSEFIVTDPNMKLSITESTKLEKVRDKKVLDLILALPHGVMYNSSQMEGIVETSCNLAVISTAENCFKILMSQRSSVMSRLDEICNKIDSVVKLSSGGVEFGGGYPAWQPDFKSTILKELKDCYINIFNKEPKIEVIHAGLECGVIGAKYPGMEMISIGPTIKHPHSPDEKLHIPSIGDIWLLLVRYLSI